MQHPALPITLHMSHRSYNRLSDLASAQYLITHQDDEVMPANCSWLPRVVSLMESYPRLGALGLKGFRLSMQPNTVNRGQHFKVCTWGKEGLSSVGNGKGTL